MTEVRLSNILLILFRLLQSVWGGYLCMHPPSEKVCAGGINPPPLNRQIFTPMFESYIEGLVQKKTIHMFGNFDKSWN